MTAEAIFGFTWPKSPSHCFFQGLRRDAGVPGCYFQAVNRRIEADQAFVKHTIFFEHPRLRAFAEIPADRKSDGASSITDRVRALVSFSFNDVGVAEFLKGESRMRDQSGISAWQLQTASHGSLRLRRGLGRVASGARGCQIFWRFLTGGGQNAAEQREHCRKSSKDAQAEWH